MIVPRELFISMVLTDELNCPAQKIVKGLVNLSQHTLVSFITKTQHSIVAVSQALTVLTVLIDPSNSFTKGQYRGVESGDRGKGMLGNKCFSVCFTKTETHVWKIHEF